MTTKEFVTIVGKSEAKRIAIECGYSDGYWRKALSVGHEISEERLTLMKEKAQVFLEKAQVKLSA